MPPADKEASTEAVDSKWQESTLEGYCSYHVIDKADGAQHNRGPIAVYTGAAAEQSSADASTMKELEILRLQTSRPTEHSLDQKSMKSIATDLLWRLTLGLTPRLGLIKSMRRLIPWVNRVECSWARIRLWGLRLGLIETASHIRDFVVAVGLRG